MPLRRCQRNSSSGWKWGEAGKCFIGPGAKQKAIRQGIAIGDFQAIGFVEKSLGDSMRICAEMGLEVSYVPNSVLEGHWFFTNKTFDQSRLEIAEIEEGVVVLHP